MDGFTGSKTATNQELPDATPVLDPFYVVRLAGDAFNECRCIHQKLHAHRGRKGRPPSTLRGEPRSTGADLLTTANTSASTSSSPTISTSRSSAPGASTSASRRLPTPRPCRQSHPSVIDALSEGVPTPLIELIKLGRTLNKRAEDVRAYLDRSRTSTRSAEAINGPLEHLQGLALDLRNQTNCTAQALFETGELRPRLPQV